PSTGSGSMIARRLKSARGLPHQAVGMPKVLEADAAYEAADRYRVACIRDSRSLLWPPDKVWTLANLAAARETLRGPKGEGGDSFLEHWRQRLSPLTAEVNQVGIDVLALYYVFVDMSAEAKLA